jgi:hypothetical protein
VAPLWGVFPTYCERKTKHTNHLSHFSLYKLFVLLCDKIQNNKNGISFLSLFIIQIIYSIVREIQKHTNIITISLTLHYTNYLFYCERKQKHTNIVLYRDKYPTGNGCDILFMVIHRNLRETSHEFAKNCYPLEIIEGRKAYPPSEDMT